MLTAAACGGRGELPTLLAGRFNVTHDDGALVVRSSIESFRSISDPEREPAEFGKGSGGVLALNTRMGTIHFRVPPRTLRRACRTSRDFARQWVPL